MYKNPVKQRKMCLDLAFTMAEAMIVLGIVAVLAALSVVAVTNSKPDENVIMFRKTYATVLQSVQTLMNDKELYPNAQDIAYNKEDKLKLAYDLAPIFLRYAAASSGAQLTNALTGDPWGVSCGSGYAPNTQDTGYAPNTQDTGYSTQQHTGTINMGNHELASSSGFNFDQHENEQQQNQSSGDMSSGNVGNEGNSVQEGETDALDIVSSSGSDVNCGTSCVQTLNNLDFSAMVTNVLGRGFADTTISDKSKQKYRYLADFVPAKFGMAFASLVNGKDVTYSPVAGEEGIYNVTFSTSDGVSWTIRDAFTTGNPSYIMVDVGSTANCYYSGDCKVPDRYRFRIDKSGKVTAVKSNNANQEDPAACAFIKYNKINKASKIPANNGCGY